MNLNEYRTRCSRLLAHQQDDLEIAAIATQRTPCDAHALRGILMLSSYVGVLLNGPLSATEIYEVVRPVFADACRLMPGVTDTGEIVLAGHANLFASCGHFDYTPYFRTRLFDIKTERNGHFAQWHFARALAGIAFGERPVYRGPVSADVGLDELMPFIPRQLHGHNPQSLLAHLAAAVENHATIRDVWPAFEECVLDFPRQEQADVFDGSCLFWIARIVHHHIGGQPLRTTAEWLSRHFNAWADGRSLPPI